MYNILIKGLFKNCRKNDISI
ncbi:MAG TPA: hypothetical protein DHV84_04190 [Desulfotomaculum sp.]|nr:hypothetical protein [Desulfotomaculum sp.]